MIRTSLLSLLCLFLGCSAADPNAVDSEQCNQEQLNLDGFYLIDAKINFAMSGVPADQQQKTIPFSAQLIHNNLGITGEAYWNHTGSKWIVKPLSNLNYRCNKISYMVLGFTLPAKEFPDVLTADLAIDITVNGTIQDSNTSVGTVFYDMKNAQTKVGPISTVLSGTYKATRDTNPNPSNYPPGVLTY